MPKIEVIGPVIRGPSVWWGSFFVAPVRDAQHHLVLTAEITQHLPQTWFD